MTRKGRPDDTQDPVELPVAFVGRLNALGFALTEAGHVYRFLRTAVNGELYLTLESVDRDTWRVSIGLRQPTEWGRTPPPVMPVSLSRLGTSSDGSSLDLSARDLQLRLPDLLGRSILPMIDLAPS